MSPDLRRKFLYSLVFALLVYIALALYSDWEQLTTALQGFPWLWLLPVIALTLVNYVGRCLRWHWYLRLLGSPIQFWDSVRIFGVGMLMVMTPGKAGEFLKPYMVRNVTGTPMSVTAPAILAERMLDGMAMLILAAAGLFVFPNSTARFVAGLVVAVFLVFITVVQIRPLALWGLRLGERMPLVKRFAGNLHRLYESTRIVFGLRNLLIALTVGAVCWAAEGAAYYVVLVGFGAPSGMETLLVAVFIFCISTVIGAAVAMPGGLGGVEGSLVALSVQILALSTAEATAAALLIRFCTLWFGVLLGVVSFVLWSGLLAGAEPPASGTKPLPSEG
ncbi:MAG: flippase-like domain-containing protein [Caldilineaceae bacterium]|nr:flippase-like domain-containing protein [Caldilineaceae bacterium]